MTTTQFEEACPHALAVARVVVSTGRGDRGTPAGGGATDRTAGAASVGTVVDVELVVEAIAASVVDGV